MKKVLLAGLCGLSLMAACVFTVSSNANVSTCSGGHAYVKV